LISFFVLSLSFSLYQGMTPLFLKKEFWLAWYLTGYVYSWIWLVIAFNQWFLIKRFWLKKFKLKTLFYFVNIWIFILFFILFFMKDLTLFLSFFFLLVLLQWVVWPIYQSEIVENATLHDRGEMMWVLWSLQSVTMFLWPLFAWYCIDKNISMYWFWAILTFINIFIVIKLVNKIKEVSHTPEEL
jgi:MFS family permease